MVELWSSPIAVRPDAPRAERRRGREHRYFAFPFDDLPRADIVGKSDEGPAIDRIMQTRHVKWPEDLVIRIDYK